MSSMRMLALATLDGSLVAQFEAAPAAGLLEPAAIANTSTLGAPELDAFSLVVLEPAQITNVASLGTPEVLAVEVLSPSQIANANVLGAPEVIDPEDNWELVWAVDSTGASDGGSQSGISIRNRIAFTELTRTDRNKLRLTFRSATGGAEGMEISSEGVRAGNKEMETTSDPTDYMDETLVGISGGYPHIIPVNSESVTSSFVFAFRPGQDFISTFQVGGTGNDTIRSFPAGNPDLTYSDRRSGNFLGPSDDTFHVIESLAGLVKIEGSYDPTRQGTSPFGMSTGDTFWGGKTVRTRIDGSVIQNEGTKIRLILRTSDTDSVLECFVGEAAASGDLYDFASAPTRVTFGGNDESGVPSSNVVVSDWIDFDVEVGVDLLLSAYIDTGKSVMRAGVSSQAGGWDFWYKAGDDAATTDATGYSTENAQPLFGGFDVYNDTYSENSGETPQPEDPPAPEEPEEDPPPDPGTWLDMFVPPDPNQSAASGFAGRTFRMLIRRQGIDETGTHVKLVFYGGIGGLDIDECYIGLGSASSPGVQPIWSFKAGSTPTQVTFNTGATSAFIPAGEFLVSDEIAFDVDGLENLVVSFYSSSTDRPFVCSPNTAIWGVHSTRPVNDSANVSPTVSYSSSTAGAVVYGLRNIFVTTLP